MSLPVFPQREMTPSREEALNQIISSIAMEELGLSHILNTEGEKLQYALGTIPGASGPEAKPTIEDLLALNKSVRETLDSTMLNQMLLKEKLGCVLEAYEHCERFLSCYLEVLGNGQVIANSAEVAFDPGSVEITGNCFEINSSGTIMTILRTGLYQIEWDINIARDTPAAATVVFGIIENGEGASGSATSSVGNFSSGTLIEVDTVPFTISLHNYGDQVAIENPVQWGDSAASIRIVRFADGAIA